MKFACFIKFCYLCEIKDNAMAKFIDPMTDTGFKIIFGKENQSNEILIDIHN